MATSKKKPLKEERTPKEFKLTITKTVQIPKFNPSMVSLEETHEVFEGESYASVYRQVRRALSEKVEIALKEEVDRYGPDAEEE